MRGKLGWVSFITALTLFWSTACWATPQADDLIRLAKSGVDEEVLMSYVKSAPDTIDLSADDIITLKDLGVPSKVISEALLHGHVADTSTVAAAKQEIREVTSDTAPPPETSGEEAPATEAPAAEAPDVQTAAAVAPAPDDQNISFFYQALYPYGNWLNIDGEWCWQPTAMSVSPDWTPYCRHGHWIWSDWGWCWESDYSWGWAPFHYGRWFRHAQYGWCWVPDDEWGPAWVSWRTGDDYCGWAPLPPRTRFDRDGFHYKNDRVKADFEFNLSARDYFFLPKGNFCDPHPWVHMVPSIRGGDIFNRTVFMKDAYRFDNGHVFNGGPRIDDISRASHREIQPVAIAGNNVRPGELIPRGMVQGNRFVIYKPTLSPQAPRSPVVIKAELSKRPFGGLPVRSSANNNGTEQRQKTAWQQTLRIQQANADASERQRTILEKQERSEPNPGRLSGIKAEADVQTMKAEQARAHVTRIKQWTPPSQSTHLIIPQSRVIMPQPTAERTSQVRQQVRTQVQNEAQREDQQSRNAERMIRTPPPEPRAQPQEPQNRGGEEQRGGGAGGRGR